MNSLDLDISCFFVPKMCFKEITQHFFGVFLLPALAGFLFDIFEFNVLSSGICFQVKILAF